MPAADSNSAKAPRKAKWLSALARIGISAVLIAIVYGKIDFTNVLATLRQMSWQAAIAVVAIYTLGQLMSTCKWGIIVRASGLERSFSTLLRSYFFGMFVNTFGLGTVGGDVSRALALRPKQGERTAALASVVADRIHGLIVLICIGALGLLLIRPSVLGPSAPILASVCSVILVALWILGPKSVIELVPAESRIRSRLENAFAAFPRQRRKLFEISLISVLFHCIQIAMVYIIANELSAGLSPFYLLATIPIVNVAAALPLSINGLGIREALYLFFFLPVGVSHEVAVAMGAVWIVTTTVVSALGGVVVVLASNKTAESEIPVTELPAQDRQRSRVPSDHGSRSAAAALGNARH